MLQNICLNKWEQYFLIEQEEPEEGTVCYKTYAKTNGNNMFLLNRRSQKKEPYVTKHMLKPMEAIFSY